MGVGVHSAVAKKGAVFWDMMPRTFVVIYCSFGGKFYLYSQVRGVKILKFTDVICVEPFPYQAVISEKEFAVFW
jgi:hypothetical protein